MEDSEFHEKMMKLTNSFKSEEKKIRKQYAFSRNTVKVGDIIRDHQGFLEVDLIGATESGRSDRMPECIYRGFSMTKNQVRRKDGEKRWIIQRYVEECINQEGDV